MSQFPSVIEAIGNTPLIKLKKASELTGCTILGKAEFLNPGQSVKDRAALFIIRDAEKKGLLKPGGVIVEGTAGNTGIGLTMVAKALGYRTVIVIPETQSQEKKDALRLLGAELVEVPAVPYKNPNNYVKVSGRLADELAKTEPNGAIGRTSSTMSPIARRISPRPPRKSGKRPLARSMASSAPSAPAERWPYGHGPASFQQGHQDRPCRSGRCSTLSILHHRRIRLARLVYHRRHRPGPHHRQPRRLHADFSYRIPDSEALPIVFDLVEEEGLCLGGSSGINIAGAIRLAKDLGPGHTVVTILCDYGNRYQSKLFNPSFLEEKGLPVPQWLLTNPDIRVPYLPVD